MEGKNLKQLKELLATYKNISIGDIERNWELDGGRTMHKITGFGDKETCSVCSGVSSIINGTKCYECVYYEYLGFEKNEEEACNKGELAESYKAIAEAEDCQELMSAILSRINIIEKVIKVVEKRYGVWDIRNGDKSYLLEPNGEIKPSRWKASHEDLLCRNSNNKYIKEIDAEYERIKRQYEYELRKATRKAWGEYEEDLDWEKDDQKKFFISHTSLVIIDRFMNKRKKAHPDYYYFPTQKSAEEFIEENKKLILKFFKVKEE